MTVTELYLLVEHKLTEAVVMSQSRLHDDGDSIPLHAQGRPKAETIVLGWTMLVGINAFIGTGLFLLTVI